VLRLPLSAPPTTATVSGQVRFTAEGAVFGGGRIVIPHDPCMDAHDGLALRFEFRADRTDGMPVLLSHGTHAQDGWFAQILDGRLLIRTPNGDARGPLITAGEWVRVEWLFDGCRQRLLVNGSDVPQDQQVLMLEPCSRDLIIGGGELPEPVFSFHGTLRNLTIAGTPVE
jgi:hypothetical protein